MPSPFPGMNPYLEQVDVWREFHNKYISVLQDELVPQVRPKYIVRGEALMFLHEFSAEERQIAGWGDVSVHLPGRRRPRPSSQLSEATVVLDAPAEAAVPATAVAVDEETHFQLEIRDRLTRQVVTVIEVLSPSNKRPGGDRAQYLSKRRQLLGAGVNVIEIDLLRGGPPMPWDGLPASDYCVVVAAAQTMPRVGVWPIGLRDGLPTIPVPLAGDDPPARLDLQGPLHRVHDAAGYADFIYEDAPDPPLSADDQAWADQVRAAN